MGQQLSYEDRKALFEQIEKERGSKVILYATSDRQGMETHIAHDVFDFFVQQLDRLWPNCKKITLILHTNGGSTSAAWKIVNLIRIFCDELEVIIPTKALSAGTIISLGANTIVMSKQAALGPIDPSITSPIGPRVQNGNNPPQTIPVSVEAIQGYIDFCKDAVGIEDGVALAQIVEKLSGQIHPLVLGEVYRIRAQIKSLANELLQSHGMTEKQISKIINFLCSESGSHDRTINRREAKAFGLNVENPSEELYEIINKVYVSIAEEMQLRNPYDPGILLGGNQAVMMECNRVLLETVDGGSNKFVTRGRVKRVQAPGQPPVQGYGIEVQVTSEKWE